MRYVIRDTETGAYWQGSRGVASHWVANRWGVLSLAHRFKTQKAAQRAIKRNVLSDCEVVLYSILLIKEK